MRVNIENNRLINDILAFTTNLICDHINSGSDFAEISKLLPWHFFKDSPRRDSRWLMIKS